MAAVDLFDIFEELDSVARTQPLNGTLFNSVLLKFNALYRRHDYGEQGKYHAMVAKHFGRVAQ